MLTDEAGAAMEAGQVQLNLGPAFDSSRTGCTVTVEDLAESSTYPPLWTWLQGCSDGSAPVGEGRWGASGGVGRGTGAR